MTHEAHHLSAEALADPCGFASVVLRFRPALTTLARRMSPDRTSSERLVEETVARALGAEERPQLDADVGHWLFNLMRDTRDLRQSASCDEALDASPVHKIAFGRTVVPEHVAVSGAKARNGAGEILPGPATASSTGGLREVKASSRPCRNKLLAGLTKAELAVLAPHLEPVDLNLGMALESPGKVITHVYFPDAGLGSAMVVGPSRQRVEAGLFGREGMSGLAVVLGGEIASHEVVVQLAGYGHRIEAAALRQAMRAEPSLRDLFLRYVVVALGQSANTVLANARLSLEARLARWLLMCHDRMDGDQLELTHEFLSVMLGVRRAGVTVAVHVLEGRGLIRATRGRIRITDRNGLEAATGGVYGLAEAEYAQLMGSGASREAVPPTRATLRLLERTATL